MSTPQPQNPQPQDPQPQHPNPNPAPHEERPPDRNRTQVDDAPPKARGVEDVGEKEPLPEERHREPAQPRPERDEPPAGNPAVIDPPVSDRPTTEIAN
jgi:hypothetical protein